MSEQDISIQAPLAGKVYVLDPVAVRYNLGHVMSHMSNMAKLFGAPVEAYQAGELIAKIHAVPAGLEEV